MSMYRINHQLIYHHGKITLAELYKFVDTTYGYDENTVIEIGSNALTIKVKPDTTTDPRDAFPRDELGRFKKRK